DHNMAASQLLLHEFPPLLPRSHIAPLMFFFTLPAPSEIYTLSLHDALPICSTPCSRWATRSPRRPSCTSACRAAPRDRRWCTMRSEEHTSELQSPYDLVCRLLLEKKKQPSHTVDRPRRAGVSHYDVPLASCA